MEQQIEANPEVEEAAFTIAGWSISPSTLRIRNAEKTVKLEPKVMALLERLAEQPGQVISRQQLEESIWAGTVVGYDAISNAIIKLRKAFDDDAQNPKIIETIPKTGYRLIAEVEGRNDGSAPVADNVVSLAAVGDPVKVESDGPNALTPGGLVFTLTVPLLLLVAVVLLWFKPWTPRVEPASEARMTLPLPDRPSIAVLPFVNNSDDPEQEYFVDGMTEDLITDLSKLPELFVVARNSVFAYKGKAVKVGRVAEELGVRYVLAGSVRRVGDDVRINARFIDALSGGHVWADRFDGDLDDVFALQDQISQSIVDGLALSLNIDTGDKSPARVENVRAYELYWKGWGFYRAGSPANYGKAVEYYDRSLAIDPEFALARAALAAVYADIYRKRWWQESLGIRKRLAHERARVALRESKKQPVALTHQVASEWYAFFDRSATRALQEAEKAIGLSPNDPSGHLAMAYALLKDDQAAAAERSMRVALRLDPHVPPEYLFRLGQIQYHLEQYEEAINSLKRAIASNEDDDWSLLYLAASHGKLNQVEQGRQALERANALRSRQGWGPVTILAMTHPFFGWRGDIGELKQGLRAIGTPVGGEWYRLIEQAEQDQSPRVRGATTIDAATARKLHDRGVAFVETGVSWFHERIPGALLLELWKGEGYRFNEVALGKIVDSDEEVVIYGTGGSSNQVGIDAAKGAAIAVSRGFTNVYYLPGGIDAWKAAGFPTERP